MAHSDLSPETPLFTEFPPVSTEAWQEKIRADLDTADPEQALMWDTLDGVAVRTYYRAEDLKDAAHAGPLLRPLRADEGDGAGNPWCIRQDLRASDLHEANHHARAALDGGATDLGFFVEVENGSLRGLPIQSQHDFSQLLDEIPLDAAPLHLMGGQVAPALLALLLNEAQQRGVDPARLRSSLGYDPLAVLARRGQLHVEAAYDMAHALLDARAKQLSSFRVLAASARPYHEAGASAVQELAFTLAAASEHFAQLTGRGHAPEQIAAALHFKVPAGTRFAIEVAKLRALRLLFAQLVRAYAPDADPPPAFIQAVTSRRQETVYDSHTNLLRATTEAAAALTGGADVLAVRPYDAAFRPSSGFGLRIARNIQLLLKHEAHFDRVADPAAGAYYFEMLTDRLARAAWALFQKVEAQGGLLEALQNGSVQKDIARVRNERAEAVATRQHVLIGTNHYPDPDEEKLSEIEAVPAGMPLQTTGRSVTLDPEQPLAALRQALRDDATLGDVLASASPFDVEAEPLPVFRAAEAFEALRLRTERNARRVGRRPAVFLLPFGPAAQRSARATFARNVFGCAGFALHENPGFDAAEEGLQAALDSGADLVVLCSTDKAYARRGPDLCRQLKEHDPAPLLVIAGPPGDAEETLREAGADGFLHRGMNVLETLRDYQQQLGIPEERTA